MMKFFRKHNKKLLAVFGVLLMIVFVGGGALDNLLQPKADRVVASSRVGTISYADLRRAENTTRILERIGLNWQHPFGGVSEPLDFPEWVLLTREAKSIGMDARPEAMRSAFGTTEVLRERARQLGVRPDRILSAVAQLTSIQQAATAVAGAAQPSEAEVRAAVGEATAQVQVATVVLPASAFIDEDQTFTEGELQEQFSEYREREAGAGLSFGYYVQPEIQVQYIKIDEQAIQEAMAETKPEYVARKAREYYEENRETDPVFARPPEEEKTDEEGEDESEEAGPDLPPYLNWEEAESVAREKVAQLESSRAAERVGDWLIQHLTERWLEVAREQTGYKPAPDAAAKLEHYAEVVGLLPRTIAYPGTVTVGMTDFFNRDGAMNVPEIGAAQFRPDGAYVGRSLHELAFLTESIVSPIPFDGDTDWMDYTATFQTCRFPLTDPDGNLYIFRVVDARPGHVPESLEEVRDRVIADLRLKSAFEVAKARGESLLSCARDTGLKEAFEGDEQLAAQEGTGAEAGMLGLGYFEPAPMTRANQFDVMRGERPEKRYLGRELGPAPADLVDRFFALEYAAEPMALIELDERATVLVVEWLETRMPEYEEFTTKRDTFAQQMDSTRMQMALRSWLDPEQIRARNGFTVSED
jgi:hypothetical protein